MKIFKKKTKKTKEPFKCPHKGDILTADANAAALAQKDIYDSKLLTPEQKCFAHFWRGYFYAHGSGE